MDAQQCLVAYGHSWVDGDGASERSRTFVESVGRALRMVVNNRAVGGSSSRDTKCLVAEEPPPRAAVYLVMTGLNDARLYGASPKAAKEYGSSIAVILGALRTASPQALTVVVEQPYLIDYSYFPPHNCGSDHAVDLYNTVLERAAKKDSRALYVRTPRWDAHTMLAPDTVHPNDSGHAYLAHEIVAAIKSSRSSSTTFNIAPLGASHADHE